MADYLKNFKISALTLRFALRDCGNRAHLPFGKCALFEISCADIALHISIFYKLTPRHSARGTDIILQYSRQIHIRSFSEELLLFLPHNCVQPQGCPPR